MMYEEYSCSVIKHLIAQGGQLIDVRSTLEFAQGTLQGADNIPIETVDFLASSLDKLLPVLLFSEHGRRAQAVQYHLQRMGFDQVHNIGGYQRYRGCMHEKLSVVA